MILIFAACTPGPVERTPAPEIQTVTREAMKLCIPGDDELTRCPTPIFMRFGLACMDAGEKLHDCLAESAALRQTGALDIKACEIREAALQSKLNSPWHSWWLWGLIGGAATATVLSGIYWGSD